MSANNFLRISKTAKGFLIQSLDVESGKGFKIGLANTFKEARDIADKYHMENPVEYGIEYRKECFND